MQYRILGQTGLTVSTLGIGGGGPSRLGQSYDVDEAQSIAVIQQALDAGVNFIDTAEAYRTEDVIGKAIAGYDRHKLVISTKKSTSRGKITQDNVHESLENSLERLGTNYIDVYHLHAVIAEDYDYLLNNIIPILQNLRKDGTIRHIGITERWNADPDHKTLMRAVQDDVWDVMMVGFNLLNQSARERVFAETIEQDVGILVMFAVRNALSKLARLQEIITQLIAKGQVDANLMDRHDPLGFVLNESDAVSLPDAAYRFCLYEPGTHVILSGTGNPLHMQQNIETFARPPLPHSVVERLKTMFAGVDNITGQ